MPPFATDPDIFDEVTASSEPGILVRTDFDNEDAWSSFCERLQQAEVELAMEAQMVVGDDEENQAEGATEGDDDAMDEDDGDDSSSSESGDQNETSTSATRAREDTAPLVYVLNPDSPEARTALSGLSNLGALRLLTDIVIRPAPARPADTKLLPPHRLRSRDGWQETYVGKTLWIYDARSNTDGCARLVSGKADLWGTATGDSWRARVSHICELQAGITSGGMTIDFGGLDRWDYAERMRNLSEAEPKNEAF